MISIKATVKRDRQNTLMKSRKQLDDLGLFDAKIPRYTSYPTALHFSHEIDPETYENWITAIPQGSEVSLYLHIPFCERLCWFCACRTQGVRSSEPVKAYLATLKKEIDHLQAILPSGLKLSRLHWGGGTPTILKPHQITELSERIFEMLPLSEGAEFSVEIDPTLVDDAKLKALAKAGMNRASIGIQDFSEHIQSAIGREQPFELTQSVVKMIRAHGISSLNADIVYGLPHQDLKTIRSSTSRVLELDPDRVALYGYAHVPWMAKRQRMIPEHALPSAQDRWDLFKTAEAMFVSAGYVPLGIDHFAKPDDTMAKVAQAGRLRRNFQGYTDDQAPTLIGLGASSISRFKEGYVQNSPATAGYQGRVRAGAYPVARGYRFSLEDRVRAMAIERILCDYSFSIREISAKYGDFAKILEPDAERAAKKFAGYVTLEDGVLTIIEEPKFLARMVAVEFDTFMTSGARHSSAI